MSIKYSGNMRFLRENSIDCIFRLNSAWAIKLQRGRNRTTDLF